MHEEALDSGDLFAAAKGILIWTCASGGRVPSMLIRVQVEIAEQIDHHYTKLLAMLANGLRLLGAGRTREAALALDEVSVKRSASGLMSIELLSELDAWRTTAWRRVAEEASSKTERRAALREARRRLPVAMWSATRFRNWLPHVLREAGRIAALGGGRRRARMLLDASLSVATRHDQAEQIAMTKRVRGVLFEGGDREHEGGGCEALRRLEGEPQE